MKKTVICSLFFFLAHGAWATHVRGGCLFYQWIEGRTYEFSAVVFLDTRGILAEPGLNTFTFPDCSADIGFTWHVEEGAVSLIANTSEPQVLEIVALDNTTFQYSISYATSLIYAYTLKAK